MRPLEVVFFTPLPPAPTGIAAGKPIAQLAQKSNLDHGMSEAYSNLWQNTPVFIVILAGGFTAMAARERVLLSRFEDNQQKIIQVNCLDIAGGKASNQFVSPGDEVYVPERVF